MRVSRMWLGALVMSGLTLGVVVIALIITSSGGDDAKVASTDTADRKPVKVVIAGTNDALEPVTDGGITGEGTFRASGAITDSGTARGYRWLRGDEATGFLISLRYVTKGKKGAITYVVRIDTTRRPVISRWTIESGTKAYKGLQGKGIESENATYTISTLRGNVWR
ncbi:MAG TPA: hypothetical protein VLA69_07855 [Gaiellaceae bacterium]|nr:hypothetical protein [Gaiellaceae bacterium]